MKAANMGLAPRTDRPETVLPRVVAALENAHRVLCVMHAGPDGDACGSTLALALALKERGKDVTLFCSTDVPYNVKFLSGLKHIVHVLPDEARWDATTVCDVGASHRIGPGLPARERLGTYLNIDHHLTSDDFGDLNLVDAEAASVGVIVFRILRAMGHPISKPIAEALYVSLVSDTGSFRYSSTNPEAMRVAADLLEAGVDPWHISSSLYEQQPVERIQLLRDVLGTLTVSADGAFASLVVTQAMKAAAHARPELTDGFINFARSIHGVEVAAQLTEPATADGQWGLSFRSRGRVNVAKIAQRFGGGGHHNAAGAGVSGTLDEVRAQVASAVADELKLLP